MALIERLKDVLKPAWARTKGYKNAEQNARAVLKEIKAKGNHGLFGEGLREDDKYGTATKK